MKPLLSTLLLAFVLLTGARAEETKPRCFELRTYHAAEGKLDALHARFIDHAIDLFQKHGVEQIAYWTPLENESRTLVFLLAYPDRDARETSWKAFLADPAWQAAKAESEKDGPLVTKVESLFLHLTDYSPALTLAGEGHVFEMRRYTTLPGKLPALDARFRNHTMSLFTKHGMTNLPYFHLDEGQEGSDTTLLYFLAHTSVESKEASFAAFRSDPAWIAARDASEQDGKILVENGVASTLLLPTDYSPMQ